MRSALIALSLPLIIALAGCGQQRAQGDPDGVPVAFTVRVDPAFVADYHRGGASTYVGFHHHHHHHSRYRSDPWHHGWHDPWDSWYGGSGYVGSEPTTLVLLGGDGPTQAQVFRKRIAFGDNDFVIPIRAGRSVTLSFQADGGIEGWETLGTVSIGDQPGQVVAVAMTADGVTLTATPPPSPPATPAAP
ncbi:MAG: hypothetical protein H0X45_04075 [Planctomycetes bacterium]|nr:hypothetical protein [Nannocystis sp.]MBA3549044.1 hypothetical protein [Nannocystis sp.]MBA3845810.1 hypothetical protein [Planctomycetota bacterium]